MPPCIVEGRYCHSFWGGGDVKLTQCGVEGGERVWRIHTALFRFGQSVWFQ